MTYYNYNNKFDGKHDKRNINKEEIISTDSSKVSVLRIPTNEELVIALDTADIVKSLQEEQAAIK